MKLMKEQAEKEIERLNTIVGEAKFEQKDIEG